jgi:hypothetical protein
MKVKNRGMKRQIRKRPKRLRHPFVRKEENFQQSFQLLCSDEMDAGKMEYKTVFSIMYNA